MAKSHLDRDGREIALFVSLAAALALGAAVGLAYVAGFHRCWHQLLRADPVWFPLAFGAQVVAYVGYVVAYREITRMERDAVLDVPPGATPL